LRPKRRAQDAIADIHQYGTNGYRWVLDADMEACFDSIERTALMERVRVRVKDKRVLALVKALLKAGILTELGGRQDTHTGTPQLHLRQRRRPVLARPARPRSGRAAAARPRRAVRRRAACRRDQGRRAGLR
jgi:hypothetical protein